MRPPANWPDRLGATWAVRPRRQSRLQRSPSEPPFPLRLAAELDGLAFPNGRIPIPNWTLPDSPGQLVGIEVKAAASVTRRDFAGLQRVASAAGTSFVQGILLYDGDQTLSFGEKLRAVPIPAL